MGTILTHTTIYIFRIIGFIFGCLWQHTKPLGTSLVRIEEPWVCWENMKSSDWPHATQASTFLMPSSAIMNSPNTLLRKLGRYFQKKKKLYPLAFLIIQWPFTLKTRQTWQTGQINWARRGKVTGVGESNKRWGYFCHTTGLNIFSHIFSLFWREKFLWVRVENA